MIRKQTRLEQLSKPLAEDDYTTYLPKGKHIIGDFLPVELVMEVIKSQYDERQLLLMRIYGIVIGVNDKNDICVFITMVNPGILIGKMGTGINKLTNTLTELFGRPTEVQVHEQGREIIRLAKL